MVVLPEHARDRDAEPAPADSGERNQHRGEQAGDRVEVVAPGADGRVGKRDDGRAADVDDGGGASESRKCVSAPHVACQLFHEFVPDAAVVLLPLWG